jgi:hypothetical protein
MQKKCNQNIIIENISINSKKWKKSFADGHIYADGGRRHSLS